MRRFTTREVRGMSYHVLCGTIDSLPAGHPDLEPMQREAELRRGQRPNRRHYAELMR